MTARTLIVLLGVGAAGCGPTQTVDNESDIAEIVAAPDPMAPSPAEPDPIDPPKNGGDQIEVVVEEVAPDPLPEPAGAAPAWWKGDAVLTDDRILVFATADAEKYLDARARAIDAATTMLETDHNAEPIAGEMLFSVAQLDDGRFRAWVRMAGKR